MINGQVPGFLSVATVNLLEMICLTRDISFPRGVRLTNGQEGILMDLPYRVRARLTGRDSQMP
jgi:hypothetical protein